MTPSYGGILLVERDQRVKQDIESALLRHGLETIWARTQAEAEHAMTVREPCLVVLNQHLPPEDGWQVFRQLRRFHVPIILMTPRPDRTVQRMALALGADDYVSGETAAEEIATRVRFVLRRASTPKDTAPSFAGITLDPNQGGARIGQRLLHLTRTEYAVLAALIEAHGRVVPRDQLVVRARANAGALPLARSIDAHVQTLRRKLDDDPRHPALVVSVRGFGYRLAVPESERTAGLASAAFDALSDPTLVVDRQGRVQIMNSAAAAAFGQDPESAPEETTCAELLRCEASSLGPVPCPGLQSSNGSRHLFDRAICVGSNSLQVTEVLTPLSSQPNHLLLQVQGLARD